MESFNTSNETGNAVKQTAKGGAKVADKAAKKAVAKKGAKAAAKNAAKAAGPKGWLVSAAIEIADKTGLDKAVMGLVVLLLSLFLFLPVVMITNTSNISFNVLTHTDENLSPGQEKDIEEALGQDDVKKEDLKYAEIIVKYMAEDHDEINSIIEEHCKENGVDYEASAANIVDNSCVPALFDDGTLDNTAVINGVLAWCKKMAADDSYGYKRWTSDKKTHQCPLCHPDSGKGWNCIGFATAAYFHGGGVTTIQCSCAGIGNTQFLSNVTLEKWQKRNGENWQMIYANGKKLTKDMLAPGDILLMYEGNECSHVMIYMGDGKIAHSATDKCKKKDQICIANLGDKNVLRAFRYTGTGSGSTVGGGAEAIAKTAESFAWPEGTAKNKYYRTKGGKPYGDFAKVYKELGYGGKDASTKVGSCCCHFARCCVAKALGYNSTSMNWTLLPSKSGLNDYKTKMQKIGFTVFDFNGNEGSLQRGDVLTWSGSSSGHVWIYLGNGKCAEAGHGSASNGWSTARFGSIQKVPSSKLKTSNKAYYVVARYNGSSAGVTAAQTTTSTSVESYENYTQLLEIKKSSGTHVDASYPSGYSVAQSFAAFQDGSFAVAFTKQPSTPSGRVKVFNSQGKAANLAKNNTVSGKIGHANGSTVDSNNELVVAGNLDGAYSTGQLFKLGAGITTNGTRGFPQNVSAIGYDDDTGNWVLAQGGTVRVYDNTLSSVITKFSRKHGSYYQDLCAAGGMVFCCHSTVKGNTKAGSGKNYVDIFREVDGAYCGSYYMSYGELESAEVVNGELVLLIHMKGTGINWIQWTGVTVPSETVNNINALGAAGSRDVVTVIGTFSVYEAQLLPAKDEDTLGQQVGNEQAGRIEQKMYGYTNRDIDPKGTLESILKKAKKYRKKNKEPALFEITYSEPVKKDGKLVYTLIEINPASGEKLCDLFEMNPEGKYETEGVQSVEEDIKNGRKKGKSEVIGETTIANAIESNTDTHLELLYDSLNGNNGNRSALALPIKNLFTTIKLSKKFEDDKTGIECKPPEGTSVYSCERSMVKEVVKDDPKLGNYIVAEGEYKIVYAHLKTIDENLKKGDMISRNKIIGTSTGLFRIEVYKSGVAIDPEPLMQQSTSCCGWNGQARTSLPHPCSKAGKWYQCASHGGSNPFSCESSGNCTWYAYGRFSEILGNWAGTQSLNGDAGNWYKRNKNNGIYKYGKTPVKGAIAVWSNGTSSWGHVAIVEKVISSTKFETSESGYHSYWFKNCTCTTTETRSGGGGTYHLEGFIYPQKR